MKNQLENLRCTANRQHEEFKKLLEAGQNTLAVLKFNQHTATLHAISRLEA